jgi:hypothetical protein
MLRDVWNRLVGRRRAETVEREAELAQMSPAERRFAEEGIEEIQADEFVSGELGGINPERLLDEHEPPRN